MTTPQPLMLDTLLQAAQLWAQVRPTADAKSLDGDVILAAQALQVGAVVITENVGHLSLMVSVQRWQDDVEP